ncbi:hypothetical protein NC652_005061 [Populus alba x Populus x berolinensis]|uniref:Uncharacterized protein n=1 Tax=Populus alba x Populus x berolinensis TaxID=444605 RepID=A0AAD6RAY5_9ROSI|nr:hypothetical protein NC652_005061 [Populus alba x Populus x berolinensis]KAJ7005566.1 hypothetical protein NC653_005016 [Populus alba x Populus x berolinensis]
MAVAPKLPANSKPLLVSNDEP